MFWVLKRTVSLRWFFWVPTTYVFVEKIEKNIFQFSRPVGGKADLTLFEAHKLLCLFHHTVAQMLFSRALDNEACIRESCADSEGGRVPDPLPLENLKNMRILSKIVRIPWKPQSHQASIQCCAIIGTPAKRHLNGVTLACQWWPAYSGIWILSCLVIQKKALSKMDPSDKSFWIRACELLRSHIL